MKNKILPALLLGLVLLSNSCGIENVGEVCFTTDSDWYYEGETIFFYNCSDSADSYFWDFGDGTTSEEFEPEHYYYSSGNYTVTLQASFNGFTKSTSKVIQIDGPQYYACFSTDYTSYEAGESIKFHNCSQPIADSYFWDFGDGYTSSANEPVHIYDRGGIFTITLHAYYGDEEVTSRQNLEIKEPYTLRVITYYEGTSDRMSGADVILYATEQDWFEDKNRLASGVTNSNGEIIFTSSQNITLYNKEYYVFASKDVAGGYYNNINGQYKTQILQRGTNDFEVDMRFFSYKKKKIQTKNLTLRTSKKTN